MTIEENVVARQRAKDVCSLAHEECVGFTDEQKQRYWSYIRDHASLFLPSKRTTTVPEVPMTEEECRTFEERIIGFGKYATSQIKDVPLDYLLWLDGEYDFRQHLGRYLSSDRIQREQGHDDG